MATTENNTQELQFQVAQADRPAYPIEFCESILDIAQDAIFKWLQENAPVEITNLYDASEALALSMHGSDIDQVSANLRELAWDLHAAGISFHSGGNEFPIRTK